MVMGRCWIVTRRFGMVREVLGGARNVLLGVRKVLQVVRKVPGSAIFLIGRWHLVSRRCYCYMMCTKM